MFWSYDLIMIGWLIYVDHMIIIICRSDFMRMQVLQCWHLLKRAAAVQFWQRNENLMKINYFTSVGHLCRNLRTYLHKKSCCLSFRFFVHLGGIDDFYIFHVKCWVWLIHQCSVSSSLFPVKYFFFLQSIPIHPTDNDTFLNIIGVLACHTANINKTIKDGDCSIAMKLTA